MLVIELIKKICPRVIVTLIFSAKNSIKIKNFLNFYNT